MKITIAYLYPELLNLYGDFGNIATLKYRIQKRGIEACVNEYGVDDEIDFENTDIIYLGGGAEKDQLTVCSKLLAVKDNLQKYISNGGVMLATCTGFEIMGKTFETEDGVHDGLSVLDMKSVRGKERFIDDVVIESDLFGSTIVGFENHISRIITNNLAPLGKVIHGNGNNGNDGIEGVIFDNLIATSLHGPLLPKNPKLADWLISKALEKRGYTQPLQILDDTEENAAHADVVSRFIK